MYVHVEIHTYLHIVEVCTSISYFAHFSQKWYQTFWDIIDDWLRERIEVKLLPDQVQSMSTLLEVCNFVFTYVYM